MEETAFAYLPLTAEKLGALLQHQKSSHHPVLFLDLRSFMNYSQVHLLSSVNVCVPMSLIKRKNFSLAQVECTISCEKGKEKFRNREGCDVVMYDNDCGQVKKNCVLTSLIQKLLEENKVRSVHYLEGGFQAILEKYPQFCLFKSASTSPGTGSPLQSPLLPLRSPFVLGAAPLHTPSIDKEPIQVLDFLFVGSQDVAFSLETLDRYNLTYILNAAQECQDAFVDNPKLHYKRLDLLDHACQNLNYPLFLEAFQFIDEARRNGAKVLVHCRAGQSRSATVVITYLIHTYRWSLQQAYRFVQEKRPSVSPNLGFMSQIVQFEKTELGFATCMQQLHTPDASSLSSSSTSPCRTPPCRTPEIMVGDAY